MTTYRVEFGYLGEGRPVPDLNVTTDSDDDFRRAVEDHAMPYLKPT